MDPVTALVAVSAVSSVAAGVQGKRAADFEAAQYREEAENTRVAAIQDETQRRRQLQRTLATQQAIRAGAGTDLFSGTFKNIQADTVRQAENDINTAQFNFASKRSRFQLGAQGANARGNAALISGFGSAARAGAGIAGGTSAPASATSSWPSMDWAG